MAEPDLSVLEADIKQRLRNPEKWCVGHFSHVNLKGDIVAFEARFVRDMKPKHTAPKVFLAAVKRVIGELDPTHQGLFHVGMVNAQSQNPRIIVSCRDEEILRRFLLSETRGTWQDIVRGLNIRTKTSRPLEKVDLDFLPLNYPQTINLYKAQDSSGETFSCQYPKQGQKLSWVDFAKLERAVINRFA